MVLNRSFAESNAPTLRDRFPRSCAATRPPPFDDSGSGAAFADPHPAIMPERFSAHPSSIAIERAHRVR
jgi:hypothetical protein